MEQNNNYQSDLVESNSSDFYGEINQSYHNYNSEAQNGQYASQGGYHNNRPILNPKHHNPDGTVKPVTIGTWLGFSLLSFVPIARYVVPIILAIGGYDVHPDLRNYYRAYWIVTIAISILSFLGIIGINIAYGMMDAPIIDDIRDVRMVAHSAITALHFMQI